MLTLRADRLATLYFFSPLLQRIPVSARVRIPILMYHSISGGSGKNAHPYYQTETSAGIFAKHMQFLCEHDYSVINLDEVVKNVESGETPEKKYVVITFDDGHRDFHTEAFPILSKYGFTATVFLPTGYIHDTARRFNGKVCLTWSDICDLHRVGVIFGSHTVTHPQLRFVKSETLEYEIQRSKETIEGELGSSIHSFSYPFAFPEVDFEFRRRLRRILEKYGYKNGVSTIIGTVGDRDDKFFLKRLPVNSWDDLPLFEAKLEGAYDWIHHIQYATKLVKSRLS